MTRTLYWSLFGGCLGLSLLTARPAWEIVCCKAPLASLSSRGCSLRLPLEALAEERGPGTLRERELHSGAAVLALAEPH